MSAPTPVIEGRSPPPAAVVTTQTTPVTELRVMSQPTTVPDITKLQNYVYDQNPGSGIYMYMAESGINTTPTVSSFPSIEDRSLHARQQRAN